MLPWCCDKKKVVIDFHVNAKNHVSIAVNRITLREFAINQSTMNLKIQ